MDVLGWLRSACAEYKFEPVAIFRRSDTQRWPVHANNNDELAAALEQGGHFLPLPKEPAALANVVEVSLAEYLTERLKGEPGVAITRGSERGYPDLEFEVSGEFTAVDIKVARRGLTQRGKLTGRTDSRITLYTGNTYYAYPEIKWPGTLRSFSEYKRHLAIIALYTLNPDSPRRVDDLELLVHETWRLASKDRSSTTREYIGAVTQIERLTAGTGEFATEAAFYEYWRKYPFKIGNAVKQQLKKLLSGKG